MTEGYRLHLNEVVHMEASKSTLRDFAEALAWTALAAGLFVLLIGRVVVVNGESMLPALQGGDVVFAERVSWLWRAPMRGEVVAARVPAEKAFLIKRVIALPYESVMIDQGVLRVNGLEHEEPYINAPMGKWTKLEPVYLREDGYFLMGDNRDRSLDSRDPSIGPVPRSSLRGHMVFRIWPLRRIGIVRTGRWKDAPESMLDPYENRSDWP